MSSILPKFKYGTAAKINSTAIDNGSILLDAEHGRMYVDISGVRVSVSDIVTVSSSSNLPSSPVNKLYLDSSTGDLYYYVNSEWKRIGTEGDEETIQNSDGVLSVIGIKEKNNSSTVELWKGTTDEYDAQGKDSSDDTDLCIITDDGLDNVPRSPLVGVSSNTNLTVSEDQVVYWTPVGDGSLSINDNTTRYVTAVVFARINEDCTVTFNDFDAINGVIQDTKLNKIMIEVVGTQTGCIKIATIVPFEEI